MSKAVFTSKVDPTYDDLPEFYYHFPSTYLRVAEKSVGDMVVYYEPRRTSGHLGSSGGRQSYFATARVTGIEKDEVRKDHFGVDVETCPQTAVRKPHSRVSKGSKEIQRPCGPTKKRGGGMSAHVSSDIFLLSLESLRIRIEDGSDCGATLKS